jgi:hypothetical protein
MWKTSFAIRTDQGIILKKNDKRCKPMRLWKYRELFLVIILIFVVVPAAAMTENPSIAESGVLANNRSMVQAPYWISVSPLPAGTYSVGDSFLVSGTTNYPAGYDIIFGAYQSQFLTGSPDLLPPIYSGSAQVLRGNDGENTWSFFVNTTHFKKILKNGTTIQSAALAGEYTLSIGQNGILQYPFTLVERNISPAQISLNEYSNHTVPPQASPRKTSASVPAAITIIAFSLIAVLHSRKQK